MNRFNDCINLYDFIQSFDVEMSKEPESIELRVLFAEILVKIGFSFQQQKIELTENQRKTLLSAEKYIQNQTEDNWDSLFVDSTNSYPYGPGDGCFSVEKTGVEGCQIGSGCKSGIGTLVYLGLPEYLVWSIVKGVLRT